MSIFEDAMFNARTAMDSVGKKAGKVRDISKLRLAQSDIKGELSQKYMILGRISYEEQVNGRDLSKSREELIAIITELRNHLQTIGELIEEAKDNVKCRNCGTYNPKNALFCNKCGEKFERPVSDIESMSPDDVIDFTEDNFEDDDLL